MLLANKIATILFRFIVHFYVNFARHNYIVIICNSDAQDWNEIKLGNQSYPLLPFLFFFLILKNFLILLLNYIV